VANNSPSAPSDSPRVPSNDATDQVSSPCLVRLAIAARSLRNLDRGMRQPGVDWCRGRMTTGPLGRIIATRPLMYRKRGLSASKRGYYSRCAPPPPREVRHKRLTDRPRRRDAGGKVGRRLSSKQISSRREDSRRNGTYMTLPRWKATVRSFPTREGDVGRSRARSPPKRARYSVTSTSYCPR
jgi:hypothetical protein